MAAPAHPERTATTSCARSCRLILYLCPNWELNWFNRIILFEMRSTIATFPSVDAGSGQVEELCKELDKNGIVSLPRLISDEQLQKVNANCF